jgi:hypothetical protein
MIASVFNPAETLKEDLLRLFLSINVLWTRGDRIIYAFTYSFGGYLTTSAGQ